MKYLLLTTPHGGYFPSLLGESVHRPGIYQWHEAFNKGGDKGEVKHVLEVAPKELENYDIIHINGCGTDVDLCVKVKDALKESSTTVIFNLDYAVETWQQGFPKPGSFYKALKAADFIFAQEPAQQAMLNYFIHTVIKPQRTKVSVPVIPHPVDTEGLKKAFVPHEQRQDKIVVCYHRYDRHIYIPSALTWDLEAYHPKMPSKILKVPVFMAGVGGPMTVPLDLFDGWINVKSWPFFLYQLSHSTIGLSYYTIHSHDRFAEECACLGIPCVGTTNSYSVSLLHPYLVHSPLDFTGLRHSLKQLLEDREFYDKCWKYAFEKVETLNHKNSKMRLLFEMNKWLQTEGKQ